MKKVFFYISVFTIILSIPFYGNQKVESEEISTSEGPLKMTFLGHATLMFEFQGKVIHIDPFSDVADYSQLPKADLILITHQHGDHLDLSAIESIKKETTQILLTQTCAEKLKGGIILSNNQSKTVAGIPIQAVPAYNIQHKRDNGVPFHPKGEGNGYILTIGDRRIYIAGDTENTPEMKQLTQIDIAFLPMNLPYTMTPEMVVDAVQAFKPRSVYIYHFKHGKTDIPGLEQLIKNMTAVNWHIPNRNSAH